jgi:hypothetical protein
MFLFVAYGSFDDINSVEYEPSYKWRRDEEF